MNDNMINYKGIGAGLLAVLALAGHGIFLWVGIAALTELKADHSDMPFEILALPPCFGTLLFSALAAFVSFALLRSRMAYHDSSDANSFAARHTLTAAACAPLAAGGVGLLFCYFLNLNDLFLYGNFYGLILAPPFGALLPYIFIVRKVLRDNSKESSPPA